VSLEEEKNKAISRRLLEALFDNGDLDTLDEVLAPNFVDRSLLPGQGSSLEEYKQWVAVAYAAFSFADFTIEEQVVQGDKVVTRFFDEVHAPGRVPRRTPKRRGGRIFEHPHPSHCRRQDH
jgi:ketosteroid isomerase-like protein